MGDAEGVMKKLLLILGCLVVVMIAAAVALPFLIPTETYKAQIEAQALRATGRELEIAGPLEFSLLPSVALRADDVRFANAPGGKAADMAQLKALEVELKVWPLLSGSVEVDRFVLVEPQIHLEVDAEGRPNWQLGAANTEPAAAPAESGEGAGSGNGGGSTLPISDIRLGEIRIQNGTLTYDDARSGTSERVPFKFAQHGESGLWVSEVFPRLAKQVDDLCFINSMHTDLPNHSQAFMQMHTGSFQFVRPSVGAWTLYGLGSENANLPGFVTVNPPSDNGGARNYGSAFLPAIYQGTKIGGNQIPASTPPCSARTRSRGRR